MTWLIRVLVNFILTKKTAVGAGLASGAVGAGILVASAAYTDTAVQVHADKTALRAELISTRLGSLEESDRDIKYGIRVLNENLILNIREMGYTGKVKKIEFETEK